MRFVETMPAITEQLPICSDGNDIAIVYYLFNKASSPLYDGYGHIEVIQTYCKELAYAYKNLLKHTNIDECGRVRIFIDTRCYKYAKGYFEEIGLDSLVRWISVPAGVRFTGYLPLFESNEFNDCKYIFSLDTDQWFTCFDDKLVDFKALCKQLDEACDMTLYGVDPMAGSTIKVLQEQFGRNYVYGDTHLGNTEEERFLYIRNIATEFLDRFFLGDIPSKFKPIIELDSKTASITDKKLSVLRGRTVGIRKGSEAHKILREFFCRHSDHGDDEAMFSILFYLYPKLKLCNVFEPVFTNPTGLIRFFSLWNWEDYPNQGDIMDVNDDLYRPEFKQLNSFFKEHFK